MRKDVVKYAPVGLWKLLNGVLLYQDGKFKQRFLNTEHLTFTFFSFRRSRGICLLKGVALVGRTYFKQVNRLHT